LNDFDGIDLGLLKLFSLGIRQNIRFLYKGETLEIVTTFTYLGIVFTVGVSVSDTFEKNSLIKH